jgi:hypothetical protein
LSLSSAHLLEKRLKLIKFVVSTIISCPHQEKLVFTWCSLNEFTRFSGQNSVVILASLQLCIDEEWHSIRQNPQVSIAIHLQIIGEYKSVRVAIDKSLIIGVERFLCVPTTNSVSVDLRVENCVRLWIEKLSCGLGFWSTLALQFVGEVTGGISSVGFVFEY